MVGTITLFVLWIVSGWLFNRVAKLYRVEIEILKRENMSMAKAVKVLQDRVTIAEKDVRENLSAIDELRKDLTSEPPKPKIIAKPQRTNWKQFRTAAERASDPERQEDERRAAESA